MHDRELGERVKHEARRARDWILRDSPFAGTLLGRDVRARAMAIERARMAKVPESARGLHLSSETLTTILRGHPPLPPGARLAPSPPAAVPILGHYRNLAKGKERLEALLGLRAEHGDVVRMRFGGLTAHLVSSPELVGEVLHTRNREFGKETRGMRKLRLVLGLGLLTSEGSFWLRQRRIAQPAFHRRRIAGFAERMVVAGEEMTARWSDGERIDAHHEMMKVTLRIVGETLLGADVTGDADRIGAAVSTVVEDVNERVNRLVDLGPALPTKRNRAFRRAMDTLDAVVLDMIAERRKRGVTGDDLLGMFMEVADEETGERMTDAQLRDEVMTIFLAGHETTANALSWALHLLSTSATVQRRLEEEVDDVLGDRPPRFEDLPRLVYTRQVIDEAMRLYPPAWMIARAPVEDTTLGGYFMPAGSLIFLSPYVVHRHPDHWVDPEGFDPDRFAPGADASRHRFAYFPFGGGPRVCIGNNFALMEATLLLATIARSHRLEAAAGVRVEPDPQVTLRPRGALSMVVRRRSAP
ncbi:MAG: cytochrome P450 [Myxococcales bacterium]|nr:cytochrome P450 [Myxococcales bacterium]